MLLLLCSVCCFGGKGLLGYFWETGLCALTRPLSRRAGEGTGTGGYGCCGDGGSLNRGLRGFSLMAAASSAMMRVFWEWKPWKRSAALVAKPSA